MKSEIKTEFKTIEDFQAHIKSECKRCFDFDCEPFSIAACAFFIDVPQYKVREVKTFVMQCFPFKSCDVDPSRYFPSIKTLVFIP